MYSTSMWEKILVLVLIWDPGWEEESIVIDFPVILNSKFTHLLYKAFGGTTVYEC